MAMHDDPLSVGPGIDELCDGPRVILGGQNIRWLSLLEYIGEIQSEHGKEATREVRWIGVRIRDGNADLALPGLIALGILPREHDKLRNLFLSLGHRLHVTTIAARRPS